MADAVPEEQGRRPGNGRGEADALHPVEELGMMGHQQVGPHFDGLPGRDGGAVQRDQNLPDLAVVRLHQQAHVVKVQGQAPGRDLVHAGAKLR